MLKKLTLELKKFFHEPCVIFKLGFPLIVSQLLITMMEFFDTIMAGNFSTNDLAGLAIALAIYHPLFLLVLGILIPLGATISQLFGEGNYEEIVKNSIQGLWLSQIFSILSIFVLSNGHHILFRFGYEDEVIRIAIDYLSALCWGIPALYAFLVLRMFTEGLSFTRPTMYISVIGLGCKVILNYILIFGKFDFPALGIVGGGLATSLSNWIMLIIFLIFIAKNQLLIEYKKFLILRKPTWLYLKEILKIGMPHGFGVAAETGMFTAVSLMMAKFGVTAIAGHQIAINVASLTFMVPMGLSIAISIRVALAKGRSNFKEAQYAGRVGVLLCIILMSLSALVFILAPEMIVKFYTDDLNLKKQAVSLLLMAAIFQISDGMQVGALGALRGLKDTRIPFFTNVFSYWVIGLPCAYIFGFNFIGPEGMWVGLIIGLSIAAVLHYWRFNILTSRKFRTKYFKDFG